MDDSSTAQTVSATSDPFVGTRIGNFTVVSLLGRGGCGAVYKTRHDTLDLEQAVKFLRQGCVDDEQRFVTEAQATIRIKHPNIINIFDMGVTKKGQLYYLMELLEGRSFAELLEERIAQRGRMTPEELWPYVQQICGALESAHDQGVVHRDLTPRNVFVLEEAPPKIKLLDFGLAKLLERELSGQCTVTGTVMGTPAYAAPEQASGEVHEISPRTDLYALGVVMYRALGGRLPFVHDSVRRMLAAQMLDAPRPLSELSPGLSPELCRLVMQCLNKSPAGRPISAAEVCRRYEETIKSVGESDPRAVSDRPVRDASRHGRAMLALLGLGIVATVGVLLGALSSGSFVRAKSPSATVERQSGGVHVRAAELSPGPRSGAPVPVQTPGQAPSNDPKELADQPPAAPPAAASPGPPPRRAPSQPRPKRPTAATVRATTTTPRPSPRGAPGPIQTKSGAGQTPHSRKKDTPVAKADQQGHRRSAVDAACQNDDPSQRCKAARQSPAPGPSSKGQPETAESQKPLLFDESL